MINENEMMTVEEAAKIMQVGKQKIRTGIISGRLPIGWAIYEEKSKCYSFIIPRERFEACLKGKDLNPVIKIPMPKEITV